MEKITVKIFGEADNYERVRDSMPDVFARIIALENLVNQLVDYVNLQQQSKVVKKQTETDMVFSQGSKGPTPKELPTK